MFTEWNALEMLTESCSQAVTVELGQGGLSSSQQWDNYVIVNSKWDLAEGGVSWDTTAVFPNCSVLS